MIELDALFTNFISSRYLKNINRILCSFVTDGKSSNKRWSQLLSHLTGSTKWRHHTHTPPPPRSDWSLSSCLSAGDAVKRCLFSPVPSTVGVVVSLSILEPLCPPPPPPVFLWSSENHPIPRLTFCFSLLTRLRFLLLRLSPVLLLL